MEMVEGARAVRMERAKLEVFLPVTVEAAEAGVTAAEQPDQYLQETMESLAATGLRARAGPVGQAQLFPELPAGLEQAAAADLAISLAPIVRAATVAMITTTGAAAVAVLARAAQQV
jgi:hypothetical protein